MLKRFFLRFCGLYHTPLPDFVLNWGTKSPNLAEVMKKEILTHNEAQLLSAFDNASNAFIPELAVSARLTPTEAESAVHGLLGKRLLILEDKKIRYVRLTSLGVKAKESWPVDASSTVRSNRYNETDSLDDALERSISKLPHN